MMIIGIDPGKDGGIVVLDSAGNIINKYLPPLIKGKKKEYDVQGVCDLFDTIIKQAKRKKITAYLEKAMEFSPGKKALMSTWFCNGMYQATLTAKKIPYVIVSPKVWQASLFKGMDWKGDSKQVALLYCKRKFPGQVWQATAKCTKPHDGIIDAVCIAEYGRQEEGGRNISC